MFFKKKQNPSVNQYEQVMFSMFHQHGGYEKNLDVMAWQIGWKVALSSNDEEPKKAFNELYYGGGSPFAFDEKTFNLAWSAAKNFVKNSVQKEKTAV